MPRKRKLKGLHVRREKRGGGFRWFFTLVIIIGAVTWFWWRHEHPPKTNVRQPPTTVAKTQPPVAPPPKPVVVTQQSPDDFPRPVRGVLEAQVALARRAISPGSIDGVVGSQTRLAISVFQQQNHLPETGRLDTNTRPQLTLDAPVLASYIVTTNDLAGLQPLGKTWLEKSEQTALAYETELELVAETNHANPELIRRLNPNVNWTNIPAGAVLQVLDVQYPAPTGKAAFVVIHLGDRFLEAFDVQTNLLVHFPCSIAAKVEKRPVGELKVDAIAFPANYTFDPAVFPESPEAQAIGRKLILQPGPNNPVGVAWISLDRQGYGIHGSPAPEQIGRTESHGCFRLANWDALYLLKLAWVGMPVVVEP